jgi:hypothetical protein
MIGVLNLFFLKKELERCERINNKIKSFWNLGRIYYSINYI